MKKTGILLAMFATIVLATISLVSCNKEDDPFCSVELQKGTLSDGITLDFVKGATASFTVKSNTSWRVVYKPSFVNLDQMSGEGNATVNVVATAENMSSSELRDNIVVQGDDTEAVTFSVIQKSGIAENCWVEPSNILSMCDGIAFNWSFGENTKYYYWGAYTQDEYSKLSENEVINDIATGKADDRVVPDNEDFACFYNLASNTNYVIVTISYAENGRRGSVVVTPITTKSSYNQPKATISDIKYYTDSEKNYYYGWNVKCKTYCSGYYTYAAAGNTKFWSYQCLENGYDILLLWEIRNEILRDGEDHSTNINSFRNGRDQMFAIQSKDGVSYLDASKGTDRYFHVLTWGVNASNELSGLVDWHYVDLTSSNSREAGTFVPVRKKASIGEIKKLIGNSRDLKLFRIE